MANLQNSLNVPQSRAKKAHFFLIRMATSEGVGDKLTFGALGQRDVMLSHMMSNRLRIPFPASGTICRTHILAIGGDTLVVVDQLKNVGEHPDRGIDSDERHSQRATWIHSCKFNTQGVHSEWNSVELQDVVVTKIAFVVPLLTAAGPAKDLVALVGSRNHSDDGLLDVRADYTLDGILLRVVGLAGGHTTKAGAGVVRVRVDGTQILMTGKSSLCHWPTPHITSGYGLRHVTADSSEVHCVPLQMPTTERTQSLVRSLIGPVGAGERSFIEFVSAKRCQYISNDGTRLFVVYGRPATARTFFGLVEHLAVLFVFDTISGQALAEPYGLGDAQFESISGSNCFSEDCFGNVCFATETGCVFWECHTKTLSAVAYEQSPGRGIAVPMLVANGVVAVITTPAEAREGCERELMRHIVTNGNRNVSESIVPRTPIKPFGPQIKLKFNQKLAGLVSVVLSIAIAIVLLLNIIAILSGLYKETAAPALVKMGLLVKPDPNRRPFPI